MITAKQWETLPEGALFEYDECYWQTAEGYVVCIEVSRPAYWSVGHRIRRPNYDTADVTLLWDLFESRVASNARSEQPGAECRCDFRGANAWLGCRCGAFQRECA